MSTSLRSPCCGGENLTQSQGVFFVCSNAPKTMTSQSLYVPFHPPPLKFRAPEERGMLSEENVQGATGRHVVDVRL